MEVTVNLADMGRINSKFLDAIGQGLEDAAYVLQEVAQDRLNVGYPPSSKIGESPHRRSGDGRRSVFVDSKREKGLPIARCGTTSQRLKKKFNYMAYWEENGRPWLIPALESGWGRISKAFQDGVEGTLDGRLS